MQGILYALEESILCNRKIHFAVLPLLTELEALTLPTMPVMVQADTYRRMKKATKNSWQGHCPATNCLWMHYLTDVILNLKPFPVTAKQKRALRDFRSGCHQHLQPLHVYLHCMFANCKPCGITDHAGH